MESQQGSFVGSLGKVFLVRRLQPLIVSLVMKGSVSESRQHAPLNQKTSKHMWSSSRLLAEEKLVEGAPRCGWRTSPNSSYPSLSPGVGLQASSFKLRDLNLCCLKIVSLETASCGGIRCCAIGAEVGEWCGPLQGLRGSPRSSPGLVWSPSSRQESKRVPR